MKTILLPKHYLRLATSALFLFIILPVVSKGQCPVPTISSSGPTTFCEGKSVVLSLNGNGSDGGPWTKKADVGGHARAGSVGFSINGKGYIGTGQDNINLYTKDFWEYDPAADTWTQKADFAGVARNSAVGFSIGSKGYIGTGTVPFSRAKDFWEYDPLTNIWTQKADFGGTAREYATGFSAGGKGYIGTGTDASNSFTKDFWEYDPAADTWTRKADFGGTATNSATGFGIGSKGYIGTGGDVNNYFKDDFWEYDPNGNMWTRKANLGGAGRRNATGFSIGDKGYIGLGGIQSGGASNDMWEYDPTTNNWTQRPYLPGAKLVTAVGFSIGSKGYIGTGWNGQYHSDFWEYDPAASNMDDYSYLWSTGETTPTIVATTAGIYTVRVTNLTGCSQVSDPVEVKVEPMVPPYIDAGGATRVCEGNTTPVTAIPGSTDPGIRYLWSSGETTQTINSGGGLLTVTTTDQNGCTATSEQFDLWMEPLPTLTWDYLQPDCSGEDNGYITIIPNGYTWNFLYTFDDWATLSGSTQTNLGPGTYYLAVESETGCRSATYPLTLIRVNRGVPQITCPPPLVLAANDGCNAVNVVLGQPSTSVSCDQIIITSSHPGTTFPVGTTIVTWTATDSYGSSTCEQTITVTDQTPPTIACPADILVEASSAGGKVVDFALPVAGDNCTSVSVTQVEGPTSGSLFPVGVTTITFRATDLAQNTVTCSFNITVTEKVCEALKITTIQVTNASCSGANTGSIIINASGGNGPYHYSIDKGETYSPNNSFYGLGAGIYHVVVESDGCVTAVHDVTITASESVPLKITCPAPLVKAAGAQCMAVFDPGTPMISGGCSPITITRSYPGNTFPVGKTIIRWEAKDAGGQTAFCEQLITVLDQIPPTIVCPADMIVQPTSLSGAKVNFSQPTVTDNCIGTSLTQIAGAPSGSVFPIGITNIIFKATDASGNTAACRFTIRVSDPYCSENGSNKKVYVCHKGKTICVSVNALGAHLGHGDQLGQCPATYTKPSAQPVVPGISVYPNPSKGQFTVQLNNIRAADASLLILDATGRVIQKRSLAKAGFPATIPINLGNTAAGIYVVRYINKGETYNTKIIVE